MKGWRLGLGRFSKDLVPKSLSPQKDGRNKGTTKSSIRLAHPSDLRRIHFLMLVSVILKISFRNVLTLSCRNRRNNWCRAPGLSHRQKVNESLHRIKSILDFVLAF